MEAWEHQKGTAIRFRVVYVFDISQTEGKDIPTFKVERVKGDELEPLFHKLAEYAQSRGLTVDQAPKDSHAEGYWSPREHLIWVKPGQSWNSKVNVILHELTHERMQHQHGYQQSRGAAETQAESVAYVVGQHYGFDTGVTSFGYVATWAEKPEELKKALRVVQETADGMIKDIGEWEQAKGGAREAVGAATNPVPKVQEPWQMTEAEFIQAWRGNLVHYKGQRTLFLTDGTRAYPIKEQKNGKLTAPLDEVLARLHKVLVQATRHGPHGAGVYRPQSVSVNPLPKGEFTLAFAVDARLSSDASKKVRIPTGTEIEIEHRFEPTSTGKRVVEFSIPSEASGEFYRAFGNELVPVGSKEAQRLIQGRVRAGMNMNPALPDLSFLSPGWVLRANRWDAQGHLVIGPTGWFGPSIVATVQYVLIYKGRGSVTKGDITYLKRLGFEKGKGQEWLGPIGEKASTNKNPGKEPWQMTYREYSDSPMSERVGLLRVGEHVLHYNLIVKALKEHKPVPPEVIANYPGLTEEYPKLVARALSSKSKNPDANDATVTCPSCEQPFATGSLGRGYCSGCGAGVVIEHSSNPSLAIPVSKGYGRLRIETKLIRSTRPPPEVIVTSPSIVVETIRKIADSDRERLMAVYLDTRNRIVGIQQVSVGGRGSGLVPTEVIVRTAILSNSGGVILVHNHPSGSPRPSPEDAAAAKRVKAALALMDIALLDMVMLGEGGAFVSLRDRGEL
ncbi:MAG: JAB domain-containing protein [Chloroflexota bacterium]|nr:JAB domain-containing protein [Chloroflexota bacterium]